LAFLGSIAEISRIRGSSRPLQRGEIRLHRPRAADQPDLEAGVAAIRKVVKQLPVRPGVYRMLDAKGDVLYVGKARALKNRVTNYTQVARLSKRLQRMVAQTRSMQIVTTNTEAEALLLEAQLIKRYRPPYNVLLATTKASPSSCCARTTSSRRSASIAAPGASRGNITARSPAPARSLGRSTRSRSCSCSGAAPTPSCRDRKRPCLLYQIRRCSAPCVGRIDEAAMPSWSRTRRPSSPASRPRCSRSSPLR
jgi:excinuclease ABC subunit C